MIYLCFRNYQLEEKKQEHNLVPMLSDYLTATMRLLHGQAQTHIGVFLS